jgi:2-methylcitrate dehydratase
MKRSMAGFIGPKDIFRNPESMFRQFVKTDGDSPFDLVLSHSGSDFAVMGMHFKMGLYEHQSAGALQGLLDLISANIDLIKPMAIESIVITAYEPAFGIIGDPAKRDPHTRQSADHSMVYIVATVLRKAIESGIMALRGFKTDQLWQLLMLSPFDYSRDAIQNPLTRSLMAKITFEHGGPEYDAKYPDGIPTSVAITAADGTKYDSGLVMYPAGHARNTTSDLHGILKDKFNLLGRITLPRGTIVSEFVARLESIDGMSAEELMDIYNFEIVEYAGYE